MSWLPGGEMCILSDEQGPSSINGRFDRKSRRDCANDRGRLSAGVLISSIGDAEWIMLDYVVDNY